MITRVLVANRGEIARRVFRTCRDLGIGTVAVYSDADADSPHRAEADRAVRLPGSAPADTYLRADLLIDAARTAGADAVHPGYGFLSENADFAQAVLDAGLTWIGPPPAAIAAMGSKVEAKKLMADAGVPVLPELDPDAVTEADLPVLIKASAGGGGRGHAGRARPRRPAGRDRHGPRRGGVRVRRPDRLLRALRRGGPAPRGAGARRRPRHRLVAGGAGVLAAAPAPEGGRGDAVPDGGRRPARRALRRRRGRREGDRLRRRRHRRVPARGRNGHWPLRLLVPRDQHPAAGRAPGHRVRHRPGPGRRAAADRRGGAAAQPSRRSPAAPSIEVRLYAEDPAAGLAPHRRHRAPVRRPGVRAEFDALDRPGIRLDSSVVDGTPVGTAYDPMLAKVVAWAPTRAEAAGRLAAALAGAQVHGPDHQPRPAGAHPAAPRVPGRPHRHRLLRPDRAGHPRRPARRAGRRRPRRPRRRAGHGGAARRRRRPVLGELPSGWRNVPSQQQRAAFEHAGRSSRSATGTPGTACWSRAATTSSWCRRRRTRSSSRSPASSTASPSGRRRVRCDVEGDGWSVALRALPRFPDAAATSSPRARWSRRCRARSPPCTWPRATRSTRAAAARARGDEDAAPRCATGHRRGALAGRRPGAGWTPARCWP